MYLKRNLIGSCLQPGWPDQAVQRELGGSCTKYASEQTTKVTDVSSSHRKSQHRKADKMVITSKSGQRTGKFKARRRRQCFSLQCSSGKHQFSSVLKIVEHCPCWSTTSAGVGTVYKRKTGKTLRCTEI